MKKDNPKGEDWGRKWAKLEFILWKNKGKKIESQKINLKKKTVEVDVKEKI